MSNCCNILSNYFDTPKNQFLVFINLVLALKPLILNTNSHNLFFILNKKNQFVKNTENLSSIFLFLPLYRAIFS